MFIVYFELDETFMGEHIFTDDLHTQVEADAETRVKELEKAGKIAWYEEVLP